MDFIKQLKYKERDIPIRAFEAIPTKKGYMSIQGNELAYCYPRKTLGNIEEYESMEVALLDKNMYFINVRKHLDLKLLCIRLGILNNFDKDIGRYIPLEKIEMIYQYMKHEN